MRRASVSSDRANLSSSSAAAREQVGETRMQALTLDSHPVIPFVPGGCEASARAFVVEPAVLLADEPTGSLDFATGGKVMELMFALNREVEHEDMPEVRRIVREAAAKNYTLGAIIEGIVNSDAFRRQGPEQHKQQTVASLSGGAASRHP